MTKDELDLIKKVESLRLRLPKKIKRTNNDIKILLSYKTYGETMHNFDIFSPVYHKVISYLMISAREALPISQNLVYKLTEIKNNKSASPQEDYEMLNNIYSQYSQTRSFNDFLFKKLDQLDETINFGFSKEDTEEKLKLFLQDCVNDEDDFAKVLHYDRFYLPRHKQMINQIFDKDCKDVNPFILIVNNTKGASR